MLHKIVNSRVCKKVNKCAIIVFSVHRAPYWQFGKVDGLSTKLTDLEATIRISALLIF